MWLDAIQDALKPEVATVLLTRIVLFSGIAATLAEIVKRAFLSDVLKKIIGEEWTVAPVTMKIFSAMIAAALAWVSQPDGNILTFLIVAIMSSIGATFSHDIVKAHKPTLPEDQPTERNPQN